MAETDTARFAHVRLPALAWGEKDGTVTNSERCISRQRAFFKAPGAARADWRIIADVAREMGFGDAFAYRSAADVFREYAALTAFENDGARLLDIGALAKLSDQDYANLAPTRWPIGVDRPFADRPFSTQDRKAKFHPVEATVRTLPAEFPLALNTGRIRDQWHTMTRTGLTPRLMRHSPEPYVDVHPRDAAKAGVAEGMLAEVRTAFGRAILLVRLSASVRESEIFAPMHWSDAFAPQARVNPLVNPRIDPASGQPEFKHTPARLAPATIAWRGFLVTRARKDPAGVWWRRMPLDVGCLYEIAAPASAPAATHLAAALFDDIEDEGLLTAEDRGGRFLRWAAVRGERLERAFFATSGRGLPRREWLIEKLAAERIDDADRRLLLVGGAAGGAKRGQCVCACFNVTREEIEAFAASDAAVTVQHVGARLKAGTNCGSCRLEIAQILARRNARAA
jgi:assimilatory nitrate reductase catalytic subunit